MSVLPYQVGPEVKPGLFPSEYTIPAMNGEKLGLLVVNDGRRGVYIDQDRGTEIMFVDAKEIAEALVNDYTRSQPAQDQEAGPGMFYVMGVFNSSSIREKFPKELEIAQAKQLSWWKRLVRMADDTWQSSRIIAQISDLERHACRQLALKRDWLDDAPDSMTKCPVCTTLVSVHSIICFACHVILKPEEYKKYQFAGGPVQALNIKP